MKILKYFFLWVLIIILCSFFILFKWLSSVEYYKKNPTKWEQRAYYIRYVRKSNIQDKIRERKESHEFTLSKRQIRKINNLVYKYLDPEETELRATKIQSVHVKKENEKYVITYSFSPEFYKIDDCCWWGFHKSWDIFTDAVDIILYNKLDDSINHRQEVHLVDGKEIKRIY